MKITKGTTLWYVHDEYEDDAIGYEVIITSVTSKIARFRNPRGFGYLKCSRSEQPWLVEGGYKGRLFVDEEAYLDFREAYILQFELQGKFPDLRPVPLENIKKAAELLGVKLTGKRPLTGAQRHEEQQKKLDADLVRLRTNQITHAVPQVLKEDGDDCVPPTLEELSIPAEAVSDFYQQSEKRKQKDR